MDLLDLTDEALWVPLATVLLLGVLVGGLLTWLIGRMLRRPDIYQEVVRPTGDPGLQPRLTREEFAEGRSSRTPASLPPIATEDLGSGIRSLIVRAVAERGPGGITSLVLCPPSHPMTMSWHVHMVLALALDLRDGRTLHLTPPAPSHEWELPHGRIVGVAEGNPEPSPPNTTLAIRVGGPYLGISLTVMPGEPAILIGTVVGAADGSPELRASATDVEAVQGMLRQGIELAAGTRVAGSPPTLGYSLPAWSSHERVWITPER